MKSLNKMAVTDRGVKGSEALYYFSHWLAMRGFRPFDKIVKFIGTMIFRTYIDSDARIGKRLNLPHGGFGTIIVRVASIGDDAVIFHNVTIGMRKPGTIKIGDRVYIGTGAIVLGPLTIGDDVRIGAGAVVTSDVPTGATITTQVSAIIKIRPGQNLLNDTK